MLVVGHATPDCQNQGYIVVKVGQPVNARSGSCPVQGQRMKSASQKRQHGLIIPGGLLAPGSDADAGCSIPTYEVDGDLAQDSQVASCRSICFRFLDRLPDFEPSHRSVRSVRLDATDAAFFKRNRLAEVPK